MNQIVLRLTHIISSPHSHCVKTITKIPNGSISLVLTLIIFSKSQSNSISRKI